MKNKKEIIDEMKERRIERDMKETLGHDTRQTQIKRQRMVNADDIRLLAGREKMSAYLHPPEQSLVRNVRLKINDLV